MESGSSIVTKVVLVLVWKQVGDGDSSLVRGRGVGGDEAGMDMLVTSVTMRVERQVELEAVMIVGQR